VGNLLGDGLEVLLDTPNGQRFVLRGLGCHKFTERVKGDAISLSLNDFNRRYNNYSKCYLLSSLIDQIITCESVPQEAK
jgi:hypothetical protein